MKASKRDRANARHEAAHAVVSVRLGLPLASTDILRRPVTQEEAPSLAAGQTATSVGFTALEPGTVQGWADALPDGRAVLNLRKLAVQAAAGAVAEGIEAAGDDHYPANDDIYQIVTYAAVLGLGESTAEPQVQELIRESYNVASYLLKGVDDGAAWDTITATLARKRKLTGDEVRAAVGVGTIYRIRGEGGEDGDSS